MPKMLSGGQPSVATAQAGAPSCPPPGDSSPGTPVVLGVGWIKSEYRSSCMSRMT